MKDFSIFDASLWERKIESEYKQREQERLATLERLIKVLKDYFKDKQVSKVYIVGSILREGMFYPFSDIDIAVEGLKEDYFRVLLDLEHMLERDVDLIELESCKFKEFVLKQGLRVI